MKRILILLLIINPVFAQAAKVYVTQTGSGNFSGSSWSNAKNGGSSGLMLILAALGQNDTVWVASGIYYTHSATTATATAGSTLSSFTIYGSKVFGGFAGTEAQLNQRNIAANPTILSGNVGQDSDPTNNARHVVGFESNFSVLDGFIIEDGYADGGIFVGNPAWTTESIRYLGVGGGIFIHSRANLVIDTIMHNFTLGVADYNNITVRNCLIRNNYSSGYSSGTYGGAGVGVFAAYKGKLDVRFVNCTFKNNKSEANGGAIYATSTKVQPIIFKRNNITYTNLQPDSINGDLTLILDSCNIDSNQSLNASAGAIYFDITNSINFQKPRIKSYILNSRFLRNIAPSNSCIALFSTNANRSGFDSLALINSRFENNYVTSQSGNASVLLYYCNDTASLFSYYFYNTNFINNRNFMWGSAGVFVSLNIGADRGQIKKCNFINNKSIFGPSCLNFTVGNSSNFPQLHKSSIIIDSCNFRNNSDSIGGINGLGLLDFSFWNPTDTFIFKNSFICNNRGGLGTAYFRLNGPLKIFNCIIDSNNSNPTNISPPISIFGYRGKYSQISNTFFRFNNYLATTNSSLQSSGALYYDGGINGDTVKHEIIGSVFQNNRGGLLGGAIASTGSTGRVRLSISNSVFQGNSTTGNGGAIASTTPYQNYKRGELYVSNCLISGNKAENGGGGIYYDDLDGKMVVHNSTIASNYVSSPNQYGAGILHVPSGSPDTTKIYNSIIWGNVANGNSHAEITTMGSGLSKLKLYNSIVKDGFNSLLFAHDDKISWQNLFMFNPLFVNAQLATNSPSTLGNYSLQFCSPGVNQGDNNFVVSFKDINDSIRIRNGIVDLGAFETNYNNGMQIPIAYSTYTPACEFNNFQLYSSNVGTATSLLWTGPDNFTSTIANPIISAPNHIGIADSTVVYRLQAFYPNSCSIDDTVAVLVKSGPFIDILNKDTSVCGSAFSTTIASSHIPGVTTPNFFWRVDSLNSNLFGTTSSLFINISSPINRKYYLIGVDPYTNCSYKDSIIVQLHPRPITSAISGASNVQTNSVQNYSVINSTGSLYNWVIQAGLQTAGGNTNSIQVTWGSNITIGKVKVVETATSGCKGDTVFFNNINVLPVTLVSFTGREQNGKVKLTWVTSSEINNSHFDIERSVEGEKFKRVGSVIGSGNSLDIKQYNFDDELIISPMIYYRLKQVDFDGNFSYSRTITLTNNGLNLDKSLRIFPNPVSTTISIEGLDELGSIYDGVGQLVSSGIENGIIDVSQLKPGIYFIKSSTESIKFIKQ